MKTVRHGISRRQGTPFSLSPPVSQAVEQPEPWQATTEEASILDI